MNKKKVLRKVIIVELAVLNALCAYGLYFCPKMIDYFLDESDMK